MEFKKLPAMSAVWTTYLQLRPLQPFNFEPRSWPTYFKCFRNACGLKEKDRAYQVNSLIYTMSDKADDILSSMTLLNEEQMDYDAVRGL